MQTFQPRVVLKIGSDLLVKFDHRDRAFRQLREQVRALPGRRWHGANCHCRRCYPSGPLRPHLPCWSIPVREEGLVSTLARRWRFHSKDLGGAQEPQQPPGVASANASLLELSRATDDPSLRLAGGVHQRLYPFQRAGASYLIRAPQSILADEMGLGKTPQSLCAVEALDAYPLLVVSPVSIKVKWSREVVDWIQRPRQVQILEGSNARLLPADVHIVNYDVLKVAYLWELTISGLMYTLKGGWHNRDNLKVRVRAPSVAEAKIQALAELHRKKQLTVSLRDCEVNTRKLQGPYKLWGLAEALRQVGFKSVIFDESHRLKNRKTTRSIACRVLARDIPVRYLLTGTPVLNRPEELAHQLEVAGQLQPLFGGYMAFTKRYCGGENTRFGYQAKGHSALQELNEIMRAHCYVRRRKAEVLKDLPAMQRSREQIQISNRAEYNRAEADFIAWLQAEKGTVAAAKAAMAEQLARITHLKRLAVKGKMAGIKRWIRDFLDGSDEKILVFAWHRDVISELEEEFGFLSITGSTPKSTGPNSSKLSRQEICDRFQQDPEVRGLVLQIQAAGEGLDLTAASNLAFVELPWTPADLGQCEARCYGRLSDLHGATAWYLVSDNTIEEWVLDLIATKQEVADAAADGEGSFTQGAVIKDLVERYTRDGGDAKGPEQPARGSTVPAEDDRKHRQEQTTRAAGGAPEAPQARLF